jgi:hypothetical protein
MSDSLLPEKNLHLKRLPRINKDGKTNYECCICHDGCLSAERAFNAEFLKLETRKFMFCKNTEKCVEAFKRAREHAN